METINIAGVSCFVDKLATLSYEQIFRNAKGHPKWKGVKDAEKLIDKELRDNGFKPSAKNTEPTRKSKRSQNRKNDGRGASKKRKRNS